MTHFDPDVLVTPHAVKSFRRRHRPELQTRDARRELYYAFKRARRVDRIDGGVLYETEDSERIPIVVREHKKMPTIVVTVLPSHARRIDDEDMAAIMSLGRVGTEEQPLLHTSVSCATVAREKLTIHERTEYADIERETALILEAVERMRLASSADTVRALQGQVADLASRVAAYEAQEHKHTAVREERDRLRACVSRLEARVAATAKAWFAPSVCAAVVVLARAAIAADRPEVAAALECLARNGVLPTAAVRAADS